MIAPQTLTRWSIKGLALPWRTLKHLCSSCQQHHTNLSSPFSFWTLQKVGQNGILLPSSGWEILQRTEESTEGTSSSMCPRLLLQYWVPAHQVPMGWARVHRCRQKDGEVQVSESVWCSQPRFLHSWPLKMQFFAVSNVHNDVLFVWFCMFYMLSFGIEQKEEWNPCCKSRICVFFYLYKVKNSCCLNFVKKPCKEKCHNLGVLQMWNKETLLQSMKLEMC